jgi:hypothetical protein
MSIPTHFDLADSADRSYAAYTFSVHDCEVLLEVKKRHQIVAIRGTEAGKLFTGLGFLDILRDMRLIPWYNNVLGWAHAGFLKGSLKIFDEIRYNLMEDKSIPIVMTGHSLGAALALLVGVLLKHDGYNVVEYVGFACPRTFVYNKQLHNKDESVRYPITIYRYECDIVPLIPIWFPFGFHHPVELTQIGDGGGIPSVADHSMGNYLGFLEQEQNYIEEADPIPPEPPMMEKIKNSISNAVQKLIPTKKKVDSSK